MSRRPVAQDAQTDETTADIASGPVAQPQEQKHFSKRGPRANEEIGAGNIVFKRGGHGRLHPKSWPFEHPDMRAAVTEAERLHELSGDTFEVYARVATVGQCDAAGGMPVEAGEPVMVCVNAHDLCYGGAGGPCDYCEPRTDVQQTKGGDA